ncbi:flagellar protein FliT [Aeromonas media]|uniref:flagellar protein FliT n=1 Tax=Aeromonas media TaxID=651 RepID=UPI001F304080|nr:flagellar protein FliT [Aeromonas media]MCE9925258.1 flagellar protein FliT [Aeromonas media]
MTMAATSLVITDLASQLAANTDLLQHAVNNTDLTEATQLMSERTGILQQIVHISNHLPSPMSADIKGALQQLVEHYLPIEQRLQVQARQQQAEVADQLAKLQRGSKASYAYQRHARN